MNIPQSGPTAPADERVVKRDDVPGPDYARIRMAMGTATYRGVWPLGVRAKRSGR